MSKKNKPKKFSQTWSNQTELGKKFGISAIAVGKLLMEAGLKDPATKLASQKALDEEYAKSTPLKDGIGVKLSEAKSSCKNCSQGARFNYFLTVERPSI